VIQRDRHAEFLTTLAVIGSSLDKFAVEIRHLQRTEVLEAEEYFSAGQKGSSAMPHKRNPITSEQISGLARILRGNAQAAMENVALWHERDISHSSVERVIVPDSCIVLDHMLAKFTNIIDKLLVYPENMKRNMDITHGLLYSQPVLLALAKKGMKREDAYRIVQRNAMDVWKSKKSFKEMLKADPEVSALLNDADLDEAFDPKKSLYNVDHIFKRVGLE
jgi:adenylosuccinate lyase